MSLQIAGRRSLETIPALRALCRLAQSSREASRLLRYQQTSPFTSSGHNGLRWKRPQLQRPSSSNPRRNASTTTPKPRKPSRVSNTLVGTTIIILASVGYVYATDTRASIHKYVVPPLLRFLIRDAEDAHHFGISSLATLYNLGMHPRERTPDDDTSMLHTTVFGHTLRNPVALSGGLDKDGTAIDPLFALGPAILEIGGITPLPQDGNPKPRVWRIPSQQAMLNRYGLNSAGAPAVALTLRKRLRAFAERVGLTDLNAETTVLDGGADVPPGSLTPGALLAIQIAKNKATPETDTAAVAADYVSCVRQLGLYADILVVNVSSPNTPGLRSLQKTEPLTHILAAVVDAAAAIPRKTTPVVMVKVSPDESADEDIQGIADAVWRAGVHGVIVANTTKTRPVAATASAAEARALAETGGYSGPALLEKTVELVGRYRRALDAPLRGGKEREEQEKVIFASGGICNGEDVLRVLNAGASVGMAYTALTYQGAGWVTETKREMRAVIREAAEKRSGL